MGFQLSHISLTAIVFLNHLGRWTNGGDKLLNEFGDHGCGGVGFGRVASYAVVAAPEKREGTSRKAKHRICRLTTELSDAGSPVRPNWQLTRPARIRSSDFVSPLDLHSRPQS